MPPPRGCDRHTRIARAFVAAVSLAAVVTAAAVGGTWGGGSIVVADGAVGNPGKGNPYPSTIDVSGEPQSITKLTVALTATHTDPSDFDMLLVGPTGARLMFLSDACAGLPWNNTTFTFDDAAATGLTQTSGTGTCPGGTYKPTDWDAASGTVEDTALPQSSPTDPALNAPYPEAQPAGTDTLASAFNGTDPNGTWKLYVVDDASGDTGSIGAWAITITANPTSVGVRGLSATSQRGAVTVRWRTSDEARIVGFNVFRSTRGATARVNRTLVHAIRAGKAAGARYAVVDRSARMGVSYTYRLQVLRADGSRVWHGSISLRAR